MIIVSSKWIRVYQRAERPLIYCFLLSVLCFLIFYSAKISSNTSILPSISSGAGNPSILQIRG